MNGYGLAPAESAASTTLNADLWQSSGRSRFHPHDNEPARESQVRNSSSTLGEKVSDMLTGQRKDSLPMYKDKPYHYRAEKGLTRRLPRWAQKKTTLGAVLGILAFLSWWFGFMSPLAWLSNMDRLEHPATARKSGWGGRKAENWGQRAESVKEAFRISWSGYEKYGWGYDVYHPVSHSGRLMTPRGMGWIIVDALDTMMVMNLTKELSHARQWIHSNLTYDQDHDVNTFETTIRMLGGLLSAHYLSTTFPGVYAPVEDELGDDLYVEKASDLADRLLGAYETPTGIPLASVNLHTMQGIPSHADGGASSTAEATSLQLEMKYLAKLTGEVSYWGGAERVMKAIDDIGATDGLVPIFVYADKGTFRGDNIRLGSRGDSYYEYLIKQYFQTSEEEKVYQEMWNESVAGIKKHLITYSKPNNWTVLAERPTGLHNKLNPKMDHLVCFLPGTLALATTGGKTLQDARKQSNWGMQQEEDMNLARELMKTCVGMYRTLTGLAPEITHFRIYDPPLMYEDFPPMAHPQSPASFTKCTDLACSEGNDRLGGGKEEGGGKDKEAGGKEKEADGKETGEGASRDDFVFKTADSHNLQRPETVESLFYLWRITGEEIYREWGWEIFQAFINYTAVEDGEGFSSIANVMRIPPPTRDNMESFWLAETLKYFYLLFSPASILPLTDVVFNTEAHPFPRFSMGKLFSTGWQRKSLPRSPTDVITSRGSTAPQSQQQQMDTVHLTHTMEQEIAAKMLQPPAAMRALQDHPNIIASPATT